MKKWIALLLITAGCTTKNEKEALPQLSELVGVSNWKLESITGNHYIYFSPLPGESIETIYYAIQDGDSTATQPGSIGKAGNAITWNRPGSKWTFASMEGNTSTWQSENGNQVQWLITDSSMLIIAGNDTTLYRKTLPLATLLARARHDYRNGTSWRDSAEVRSEKLKKVDSIYSIKH